MAMTKYKLRMSEKTVNGLPIQNGPWEHFHSYCWHKTKNEHYPNKAMIGLPASIVDCVVNKELALYNGKRTSKGVYFKTEEDLAFFLLKWS